ncbi:MAG: HYR domain-containing protein [Deltaproteobacteria bacterium]|nr:HYR domain-containing protein [Deltaproteobacteria bacterium]
MSPTPTATTSPASGAVFPVGTTTVTVRATDDAGNIATGSFTVAVLHNFSGFLQPVDELPTLNVK